VKLTKPEFYKGAGIFVIGWITKLSTRVLKERKWPWPLGLDGGGAF